MAFDARATLEADKLPRVARKPKTLLEVNVLLAAGSLMTEAERMAGKKLPFDTFAQLRQQMVAEYPELGRDGLIDLPWSLPKLDAKAEGPIRYPIGDFFMTNAICRNSPTMRRCSEELVQGVGFQEAAE